jgi:hypothetical protein
MEQLFKIDLDERNVKTLKETVKTVVDLVLQDRKPKRHDPSLN